MIDDVWDVSVCAAPVATTSSSTDVFVPGAPRAAQRRARRSCTGPGQAVNTGPLYKLPVRRDLHDGDRHADGRHGRTGAYDAHVDAMRERGRGVSLGGGRFAEDQFAQVAVARAASEIDAADPAAGPQHLASCYACAEAGREIPMRAAAAGPARPGARHRARDRQRSTCCSRPPAATRSPGQPDRARLARRPRRLACTWPTTPSGPWRCTARGLRLRRSRTTWSEASCPASVPSYRGLMRPCRRRPCRCRSGCPARG